MRTTFLCLLLAGSASAGQIRLLPEKALTWQPPAFEEADLHPRIPFLKPEREWERMDIWVPKGAAGPLPCVVVVYGGGYGDKNMPTKDWRPLLKRGYVVAAPDYSLGSATPVPLCAWDVANAIRFLRANAQAYRIDPERIGIWGWSAGGWIAQDLCYAGPERMVRAETKGLDREKTYVLLPMLQPRPQHPEQSVRVQAVVSDWGAEKLWDKRTKEPRPWLSADDPPLFTCYNGELTGETVNPVILLKRLGVPARGVYGMEKNTHVPDLRTPCVTEDGTKTTWGESIYAFLDSALKRIDTATAPEMIPHGGPIAGETSVRLLTVHPTGSIHYTLDGSEPGQASARYTEPVSVKPGATLKAIVIRPGLKPSRVATGVFRQGPPRPRITTKEREFQARIGEPFAVTFQAENAEGAGWYAGGMLGGKYREFEGKRFNPPASIPWLSIDAKTGVLGGTPRGPGVLPVIVSCVKGDVRSPENAIGDAVLVVVTVTE